MLYWQDLQIASFRCKSAFIGKNPHRLNASIRHLNDTIYNYFVDNFGIVESTLDEKLVTKYKDHSGKDLKKALSILKSSNSDLTEIKYVSHTLRKKIRTIVTIRQTSTDTLRSIMTNTSKEISGVTLKMF